MLPLVIAGAVLGAAFGVAQNDERIKEAERQKKLIDLQQAANRRKLGPTSEILAGNLSVAAMQASGSSKKGAVGAFQGESAAAAQAGTSGLSGGSGFYNLDRQVAEDRQTLLDLNKQLGAQINTEQLAGGEQIAGIKDQISYTQEQQDQMQEKMGYLSSGWAFMLSAASGALNGASIGSNITELGVKMTGDANFGAIDFAKPMEGQAGSLNGMSDTLANYHPDTPVVAEGSGSPMNMGYGSTPKSRSFSIGMYEPKIDFTQFYNFSAYDTAPMYKKGAWGKHNPNDSFFNPF